jgi:transposase
MTDEKLWVGLDLGLRRTHVSIVDANGVELMQHECDTNLSALKNAMAAFPTDRIGLIAVEASNDTHIVRKLRGAGFPVAIFEARKASKFLALRKNKTDASDARGLADLARIGRNTVSQIYLKSPECQQLRGLLIMRKRLVMMRVAAEGSIRSMLALHGRPLKSVYGPGRLRDEVQTELAQLNAEEGLDLRADLEPLVDVCESLRAYLKKLEHDLKQKAKSHAVCRLFMEVPGVGPICALSFYTAIEDPHRFQSASDVGAYLGLSPRRYQSGAASRTLGITKAGSKLTRTHLVTAATVFGNTAPD